ncbi:MAG: signal peptidase [Thermoleophilaceae bacterium]|nr:signal peptidase [Thermoleophilaceae bacterium]
MRLLALLVLVAVSALMLVPALLGYDRYVVTGGSMGGAIPRGSIVYEERVPVSQLRPGDVITYTPPGHTGRVTHRIAAIGPGGVVRTKGDANAAADPGRFPLRGPVQAVARFHVPVAGYAFAALGIRWVRMLVIGLPALLVAVTALGGLRRQAVPA